MAKLWIATLLLLTVISCQAQGGQLVTISEPAAGTKLRLSGYLAKPSSPTPHSAVVVLHSCARLSNHTVAWADTLARLGYVALAVDSFGPRGITDRCTMGFQDQTIDAWRVRDFPSPGAPWIAR